MFDRKTFMKYNVNNGYINSHAVDLNNKQDDYIKWHRSKAWISKPLK